MFKKVLVALCDKEHSLPVIRQAILLAKQEQARILGAFVIHHKDLIPPPDTVTRETWLASVEPELRAVGQGLLNKLAEECAKAEIQVETKLTIGQPEKELSRLGYTADVIVVGRYGEYTKRDGVLDCHVLEGIVRQATRPVLVAANQARKIEKILVAYDGGAAASVALSTAARIATEWRLPLVMATVLEKNVDRSVQQGGLDYLESHGVEVKALLLEGIPSEEIMRTAEKERADLIVMGAYCHSRVQEIVTSGTLGQVLGGADRPVLVCC